MTAPRKSKRPIKTIEENVGRATCLKCFRVSDLCLCSTIVPFEIEPLVVLLVHPREFMKTIGTVRIVKLALKNSIFWRGFGHEVDHDKELLALIENPNHFPTVLFPGADSINLTALSREELSTRIPPGKRLVIFVIDGTWTSAKQMIRTSEVLQKLTKLSFNVVTESTYQFRKQPQEFCLSTVEAVSLLVENLNQKGLCKPTPKGAHFAMLKSFEALVDSQVRREPSFKNPAQSGT